MKYSVVIPAYNSGKYIKKCVDSVLNQTYSKCEVIVVDDLSTDNTSDIFEKYYKNNKKVKYIKLDSKRYSGGARNVGILASKGDYILCIDSDDWLKDENVIKDINDKLNGEDIMLLGFDMLQEDKITCSNILTADSLLDIFTIPFPAPWLKCCKRELYLKSLFPEGTLFEDKIQNYFLVNNAKSFTCLGRTTHIWNRNNENSMTFNPKWSWYRFEYCGELYRYLKETELCDEYKKVLLEEINTYINSCKEMVNEL